MKTQFTEHPGRNELHMTRDFNGPVSLLWRAFTETELLDQWWAPKPWKAVTKSMDFREGGSWHYCMQGPDDEKHWGRMDYLKITVEEFIEAEDVFCDEEGKTNTELPGTKNAFTFTETENGTRLHVITTFASAEALRQLVEMGVKEGTAMAHDNLDRLMEQLMAKS